MNSTQWLPAKGPKLSDHDWGDLCMDSSGGIFLIGDAVDGSNETLGCGCCASDITMHPIVQYRSIITFDEAKP